MEAILAVAAIIVFFGVVAWLDGAVSDWLEEFRK
jgi:hypothetical protein